MKSNLLLFLTLSVFFIIAYLLMAFVGFFWISMIILVFFFFFSTLSFFMYLDTRHKKPAPPLSRYPFLSVVIPNYNDGATILQTIEAVKQDPYPGEREIMVVDDGSTDNSLEKLKGVTGIQVISQPKNAGKAAALNTGFRAAKGELVATVDADTYPQPGTLSQMSEVMMSDTKVGGVVGKILAHQPGNLLQRLIDIEFTLFYVFFIKALSYFNGVWVTPGETSMYRKQLILDLGGFEEGNITEDMEIALRMRTKGYVIKVCDGPPIYTEVPRTIPDFYRQRIRWYRGFFLNTHKYRQMLFNSRYGEFGSFFMPSLLISNFLTIIMFFSLMIFYLQFIFGEVGVLFSLAQVGLATLYAPNLVVAPNLVFFLALVVLVMTMITLGFQTIHRQSLLRKMPSVVVYILLYFWVTSAIYAVSLAKELLRSNYEW